MADFHEIPEGERLNRYFFLFSIFQYNAFNTAFN